jgi:hypothetical protein
MLAKLRQSHLWEELELMQAPISIVEQITFPLQTKPPRPAVSQPMPEQQPRRQLVAMRLVVRQLSRQARAPMSLLLGQQKPSFTAD